MVGDFTGCVASRLLEMITQTHTNNVANVFTSWLSSRCLLWRREGGSTLGTRPWSEGFLSGFACGNLVGG